MRRADGGGKRRTAENPGLTWDDITTWHYGVTGIPVRPTPSNEAAAEALQHDLQDKYCHTWRKGRCDIPGKRKAVIKCPEKKCSNCPHPQYRDQQKPKQVSLEGLKASSWEAPAEDDRIRHVDIKVILAQASAEISKSNSRYLEAITLHYYYGYPKAEIAVMMGISESGVNYLISKACEIGDAFKTKHGITLD